MLLTSRSVADCFRTTPRAPRRIGADDIAVIFGGSQNDDAGGQRVKVDFLEHSQAILVRHAQVEQQNVGLELGKHLDAIGAIRGLADNGDIISGAKQLTQAITEDGVVVSDESTDGLLT